MARNTIVTEAVSILQLQRVVIEWELGSTNPESRLQMFDNAQPANPSVAPGQTPVFEFLLNEPNPVTNPAPASPGAVSTMNGLPKTALAARNTDPAGLQWHRIINRAGTGVMDGTTGPSPALFDIYANVVVFTSGQQAELQAWQMNQPQGPAG